jgi:hypothetical protein
MARPPTRDAGAAEAETFIVRAGRWGGVIPGSRSRKVERAAVWPGSRLIDRRLSRAIRSITAHCLPSTDDTSGELRAFRRRFPSLG